MFEELGDRIWRRNYESLRLNVGVIAGDDGLLVVDTRASHRQAKELLEDLSTLTSLPVRWVVNTHWHWDHAFGNALFREALLIGHRLCRRRLQYEETLAMEDALRWLGEGARAEIEEVVVVPPSRVFDDQLTVDIGFRQVEVRHPGRGHTDTDVVVTVPDADVAFAGDLLEQGAEPNFGDAYPQRWPSAVEALLEMRIASWVPGHGEVMDAAAASTQHEELLAVAARCAAGLAGQGFDAAAGPYSEATMRTAYERAELEAEGSR